jgi:hypothetical protein
LASFVDTVAWVAVLMAVKGVNGFREMKPSELRPIKRPMKGYNDWAVYLA